MIQEIRFRRAVMKYMGRTIVRFEKGVNLLVGPNGSGKSTVLRCVHSASKNPMGFSIKMTKKAQVRLFDAEMMNPRTMDLMSAMGQGSVAFSLAWHGKSKSHGQAISPIVTNMMDNEIRNRLKKKSQGSVTILLDEPESGLDHDAMKQFVAVVKKYQKKAQFIIATHSVWLWKNLDANLIVLGPEKKYAKRVLKEYETGEEE